MDWKILYFEDGTCVGCTRPDGGMDEHASWLVGIAVVSWLVDGCMYCEYVSGARAVLRSLPDPSNDTASIRFFSVQ
jgi:hypothetical protein